MKNFEVYGFDSMEFDQFHEDNQDQLPEPSPLPQPIMPSFDDFLIENIDVFDKYVEDIREFSMRSLTRKDGVLTATGPDDFVKRFDETYKGYPNGIRKTKIKNLLKKHPSLQSTNPEIMWLRISSFIKRYDDK